MRVFEKSESSRTQKTLSDITLLIDSQTAILKGNTGETGVNVGWYDLFGKGVFMFIRGKNQCSKPTRVFQLWLLQNTNE